MICMEKLKAFAKKKRMLVSLVIFAMVNLVGRINLKRHMMRTHETVFKDVALMLGQCAIFVDVRRVFFGESTL